MDNCDNCEEIQALTFAIDQFHHDRTSAEEKRQTLDAVHDALWSLRREERNYLLHKVEQSGIIASAICLVEERTDAEAAADALFFLADFFDFACDCPASRVPEHEANLKMVLGIIPRLVQRLQALCGDLAHETSLLSGALRLCVNIAASYPLSHPDLVPLVDVVCLQILGNPRASNRLHRHVITLLANLAKTVQKELRCLNLFHRMLALVVDSSIPEMRKSVAESVIIYLYGCQKCNEIDELMSMNVVDRYCVPLLEVTLGRGKFRGMLPHLEYSVRVFQILAQSREYAETLRAHEKVIPLLLQSITHGVKAWRDTDLEGCRLALETLRSFCHFRLWPNDDQCKEAAMFVQHELQPLLSHCHTGIRRSAAGLWACLNTDYIPALLLVGRRLEMDGRLPSPLWDANIITCLFPLMDGTS